MEFEAFPKIARWNRQITVTEKLDGTNASVGIVEMESDGMAQDLVGRDPTVLGVVGRLVVRAGSRNRWLEIGKDNYGFAAWVSANAGELTRLGPGRHFGEWWGEGIQRRYGIKGKRFSLFNVNRWSDSTDRPTCVDVVPVLYSGVLDADRVRAALTQLETLGSVASPGFMRPEGIVIFHSASRQLYKVTLENDGQPKSLAQEAA